MSLEERVARLEALREIEACKARYAALADAKYISDHRRVAPSEWRRIAGLQAACFADDAVWEGGDEFGGARRGRAAIADWFTLSPWRFALHFYVAPLVVMTSAVTADAEWRLWQIAIREGEAAPVWLGARTAESYRLEHGVWLITHMRFREIHVAAITTSLVSLLPSSPSVPNE